MFSPGDVVGFWSDIAGKHKYHLCVHEDGLFLFINSPKRKSYPGDFNVLSDEITCLLATPKGTQSSRARTSSGKLQRN